MPRLRAFRFLVASGVGGEVVALAACNPGDECGMLAKLYTPPHAPQNNHLTPAPLTFRRVHQGCDSAHVLAGRRHVHARGASTRL